MNPVDSLPHAPATERNREPILDVLRVQFASRTHVLEVGSGTGQHAVHFAAALPHLQWQCSDRAEALPGIRGWLATRALPNTPAPLPLDVDGAWPEQRYDAAFTANTLHILSWPQVQRLFHGLAAALLPDAVLVIYGPFRYGGAHTSPSNAAFDQELRLEHPERGIRDIEQVRALARHVGLQAIADLPMPANNRCLVWRRG